MSNLKCSYSRDAANMVCVQFTARNGALEKHPNKYDYILVFVASTFLLKYTV